MSETQSLLCRPLRNNPMSKMSRRKFTRVISSAGLAGTALLERMYAEVQDSGYISRESMRSFLDLSGTRVREDQLGDLHVSLVRALENLKRIRDRNVPQSLEPAVMFRVRR